VNSFEEKGNEEGKYSEERENEEVLHFISSMLNYLLFIKIYSNISNHERTNISLMGFEWAKSNDNKDVSSKKEEKKRTNSSHSFEEEAVSFLH